MKYIIIENKTEKIEFYDQLGIDRIMIDLEIIGKKERQGHLNTVISEHTLADVKNARKEIKNSKLLVRINPIGEHSEKEINQVLDLGADILMLPMFKKQSEVQKFLELIDNRAQNLLLLETREAYENLDEILKLKGINEIHIGLNDLHLSLNLKFMLELWSNGVVDQISKKLNNARIPFGVGGVAKLDGGLVPGRFVLDQHKRVGSQGVILSRSFSHQLSPSEIKKEFELLKMEYAKEIQPFYLKEFKTKVEEIAKGMKS